MAVKTYLLAFAAGLLISCENHQSAKEASTMDQAKSNAATYPRLKQLPESAPVAKRVASKRVYHGETLLDDYYWLKYPDYPKEVDDADILDYLKAENAYHAAFLKPHKALVDTIFEEFKGRTDETETSVPYTDNGYEYRWYYRPGEEYRTYNRKNLATGKDEVLIDETALAKDHKYFVLGSWTVSPEIPMSIYQILSAMYKAA